VPDSIRGGKASGDVKLMPRVETSICPSCAPLFAVLTSTIETKESKQ